VIRQGVYFLYFVKKMGSIKAFTMHYSKEKIIRIEVTVSFRLMVITVNDIEKQIKLNKDLRSINLLLAI